jgi:hypothetical protein
VPSRSLPARHSNARAHCRRQRRRLQPHIVHFTPVFSPLHVYYFKYSRNSNELVDTALQVPLGLSTNTSPSYHVTFLGSSLSLPTKPAASHCPFHTTLLATPVTLIPAASTGDVGSNLILHQRLLLMYFVPLNVCLFPSSNHHHHFLYRYHP